MKFILLRKEWDTSKITAPITNDPYQAFFVFVIGTLFSMFIGLIGALIYSDYETKLGATMVIVLCSFIVAAMFLNFGDHTMTAKETFWGGVILTVVLYIAGFYGLFAINIVRFFAS